MPFFFILCGGAGVAKRARALHPAICAAVAARPSLGPGGLVPTQVQILPAALLFHRFRAFFSRLLTVKGGVGIISD